MPSKLVMMSWSDDDGQVDFPTRPDNSLPSLPGGRPVYPSHALPGSGHISTLPVFPFDPTVPSNELPSGPPAHVSGGPIMPGARYIVKWLCGSGLILVPDNTLPSTPEPK